MKHLILSVMTISLAGLFFLGSGQAIAQQATLNQIIAWDLECVRTWEDAWIGDTCPSSDIQHFIGGNQQLACKAKLPKCPNNQGGTYQMQQWVNLKTYIPTTRYCVLNNGKGTFFQQGSRPSNCQDDNW